MPPTLDRWFVALGCVELVQFDFPCCTSALKLLLSLWLDYAVTKMDFYTMCVLARLVAPGTALTLSLVVI